MNGVASDIVFPAEYYEEAPDALLVALQISLELLLTESGLPLLVVPD